MKKIKIISRKYGTHYVIVDDQDYKKVIKKKWNLSPNFRLGEKIPYKFYAIHSMNLGAGRFTSVKMHRFILGHPGRPIDHINNDGLDNRRKNMRFVTNLQNSWNAHHVRSVSGYKGVCYRKDKDVRPYQVRIRVFGKIVQGGFYDDPVQAAKKYDSLAHEYFGEYARPNFV